MPETPNHQAPDDAGPMPPATAPDDAPRPSVADVLARAAQRGGNTRSDRVADAVRAGRDRA